jgi:hypothetical protein
MSITHFLLQLFEHGRVTVSSTGADEDTSELHRILEEYNTLYRSQLPAGLPAFDLKAAIYGAVTLHRACQFLAYRDFTKEDIHAAIAIGPVAANPAEHLSVDLTMRFLPDVVRLATAAAPDDPLVNRLLELGRCWPLSSVGIAKVVNVDVTPLINDPGVFRLYVDRVLSKADASRLAERRVREAIAVAVGAFPELAGSLARKLVETNGDQP